MAGTILARLGFQVDTSGINQARSSVQGLGTAAKAAAAAFAAWGVTDRFIQANKRLQDSQAQMRILVKDSKLAAEGFKSVQYSMYELGITASEATRAFGIFRAQGLEGSSKTLKEFNNIAVGTGKTIEQVAEAVADAGQYELARLNEIFASVGVKFFNTGTGIEARMNGVAQNFGRTGAEIAENLRKLGDASVDADDKLFDFANGSGERMKTLSGIFTKYANLIDIALFNIGNAIGLNDKIEKFVESFVKHLPTAISYIVEFKEAFLLWTPLGRVILVFTGILDSFKDMMTEVGTAIIAYKNAISGGPSGNTVFDQMSDAQKRTVGISLALNVLGLVVRDTVSLFKVGFGTIMNWLTYFGKFIGIKMGEIQMTFGSIGTFITGIFTNIKDNAVTFANNVLIVFDHMTKQLTQIFSAITESAVAAFDFDLDALKKAGRKLSEGLFTGVEEGLVAPKSLFDTEKLTREADEFLKLSIEMIESAKKERQQAMTDLINDNPNVVSNFAKLLQDGVSFNDALMKILDQSEERMAKTKESLSKILTVDEGEVVPADAVQQINDFDRALERFEKSVLTVEDIWNNSFNAMSDTLTTFFTTGEFGFKDFISSIATDIIRFMTNQAIINFLSTIGMSTFGGGAGALAGTPGSINTVAANGKAFGGSGNIIPFAKGGVVNSPTLFPFAKGTGLMGEAGPEAIMPLTRGADGKLGVQAQGMGGGGSVINIVNNIVVEGGSGDGEEDQQELADAIGYNIEKRTQSIVQKEIGNQQRRGGLLNTSATQGFSK